MLEMAEPNDIGHHGIHGANIRLPTKEVPHLTVRQGARGDKFMSTDFTRRKLLRTLPTAAIAGAFSPSKSDL